jgi:hypothetical protein
MKIRPMGAELFHADQRTDMTKLIVAFRKFANAPKKVGLWYRLAVCVCVCVWIKNMARMRNFDFTSDIFNVYGI